MKPAGGVAQGDPKGRTGADGSARKDADTTSGDPAERAGGDSEGRAGSGTGSVSSDAEGRAGSAVDSARAGGTAADAGCRRAGWARTGAGPAARTVRSLALTSSGFLASRTGRK